MSTNRRRRRHTPEQIVRKLRDAAAMLNSGKDEAAVLQALEVSESTYERWLKQYGGMKAEEAKRLKEIETENERLKKIVGELTLDNRMLKHLLVSPSRRRSAVHELQVTFEVSERRACKVVGQPRSSQRYAPNPRDDESSLVRCMLDLVHQFPRYGYRRIAALLRRESWKAGATRIYRLWRREGLKVPQKKRKRRRLGSSTNGCHRHRAQYRNPVWCWDFAFDHTSSGSTLKWFSVVDEFTRENLALKVDRNITSEDVIDSLAERFAIYGVPRHIRSDNGPEFIAEAIRRRFEQPDIKALSIEPGSP